MRTFLLLVLVAAGGLRAQTFAVTNTNDAGPGSLRAAMAAANAYGPGARVQITAAATAAPIVLTSNFLPPVTANGVTFDVDAGAGRLTIDTSQRSFPGLEVRGAGVRILAPLRIVVDSGYGVAIRTGPAEVSDLDLEGGAGGSTYGAQGLLVDTADDVTVRRCVAAGFDAGILALDSHRLRVATDPGAALPRIAGCRRGVVVDRGSDLAFGSLACTDCDVGVYVVDTRALRVGSAAGARSRIDHCRVHGVQLARVDGAVIENADVLLCGGTGGYGIVATTTDDLRVQSARIDGCTRGGIVLTDGCARPWLGSVTTAATLGSSNIGIEVSGATGLTVVDSIVGPGHQTGVSLGGFAGSLVAEVALARCAVFGNLHAGVSVGRAARVLVHGCIVAANTVVGLEAAGASLGDGPIDLTIAETQVTDNAGEGIATRSVQRLRVGPGNTMRNNYGYGLYVDGSTEVAIVDNLLESNRNHGIEIKNSPNCRISGTELRTHSSAAIVVIECPGGRLGPGIVIDRNNGTGLRIENCEDVTVFSSRITNGVTTGVHLLRSDGTLRPRPNVLQSCLIAGHGGLGVFVDTNTPTRCELSTITGNRRGVHSSHNPLQVDSCIVWGNLLEDLQTAATATTIRYTLHVTPPPDTALGNSAANPRFVDAASGDWRISAGSPAIDTGNPANPPPPDALDAFLGPRAVGAFDRGAYEFGPHSPPGGALLSLARDSMSPGGGGLTFRCRYPASNAGMLSLLLLQLGPPSGSFQALGATVPLSPSPLLLFATQDGRSLGTVAAVPPGGLVEGVLLWAGIVPAQLTNASFSLCAVALDGAPLIRSVSNPVTFTVR
jgi:parallel beta-helix repeat protein